MSESPGRRKACPHCGAIPSSRLSLGWLKYAAVVLGAVGLLTVFLLVGQTPASLVSIGDLSPTMDSTDVRVEGTVSRQPDYDSHTGLLGFSVDDGTGELRIVVPGEEADVLRRGIPRLGDGITVDGTVLAREGSLSLTVRVPGSVSVTRPEPTLVEIGALTPEWDDRPVEVMGVVRQVRRPISGLTIISLRDGSGVVDIVIPEQVTQLTGDLHPGVLVVGASLRVHGVVTLWGGAPQIALTDAAGAAPLPVGVEFAPRGTVEQIGRESVGQFRQLLGVIMETEPFSAGLELELDDGTGVITVLLSRDLADLVAADGPPVPGLRMEVVGEITGIGGEWSIIPETSMDVSIVGRAELTLAPPPREAPAATPTPVPVSTVLPTLPPPEAPNATPTAVPAPAVLPTLTPLPTPTAAQTPRLITALAGISAADAGQMRTVQAQVVTAVSFSAGFKFVLDDGTGEITLLLWEDRYAGIGDRNGLRPGAILQVTGKVSEYRGELQLEPYPEEVVILERGDGPAAELVATGQLVAFIGHVVAVRGRVVRLETFSGDSARLFVDDGSGEAQVILWHNVLELVPSDLLAEGAVVHIVGEVSEYRSSVELVPALPVYLAPGVLPGG